MNVHNEWSNQWNPFNSAKVLIWREWLEGIAKQDFLTPITVDTDPSNRCNYNCPWCNAHDYMKINGGNISKDHLYKLADFYTEWGVRSTCVAGGGEPFMNPSTPNFLIKLKSNGLESGVITNGSILSDKAIDTMVSCCRWIGISVDAGTADTYLKAKGISNLYMFEKVICNIEKLAKEIKRQNSSCRLCYKYLLHPLNADEILTAVKIAKQIGVDDFHLRPVGLSNLSKINGKDCDSFDLLIENINYQIEESMKLENENFKFFGIRHKFTNTFKKKINFSRCWASPLNLTFGPDGNCHLCFDIRGRSDLILCSHYPDPNEVLKHWNSNRHKLILKNINIDKCPRCSFGPYNEIIEQVFINDSMCRFFP